MEKRFHSNQSNRDLAIQIGRCNVPTIIRGLSFITRLINNYALLLHETMDLATQRYYTLINTGRSILFATTFTQFYFLSAQIVSSAIFDSQEMEHRLPSSRNLFQKRLENPNYLESFRKRGQFPRDACNIGGSLPNLCKSLSSGLMKLTL